tara:strand:+ start:2149 stop:3072 length:924 start_codon:yes stop_codon:yes gene_type:complete
MLIKESDIRRMIRQSLMSEVTMPRMGNLVTMKEEPCDNYRDTPEKFANLLKSGTFGGMADTLTKEFPKLASDLGILGLGKKAGKIKGDTGALNDIASIAGTNNAEMLFGYISSALYTAGMGCLGFYYLDQVLNFLGFLLGDGDESSANAKASQTNDIVRWKEGINEASAALASDSTGFINNYPFYALPSLAAKGPEYNEEDNVDLLKKDLKAHQAKIDKIRNVKTVSPNDGYKDIVKILELSGTAFNQKIDLSKIDSKDRQLVEKLKKSAIVALLDSLVQARLSYNSIIDTDRAFKREFENFFTANS